MKPKKPATLSVACRVPAEVKTQLIQESSVYQMSLCEYTSLKVCQALSQTDAVEQLRQQQAMVAIQLEEAQVQVRKLREEAQLLKSIARKEMEVIVKNVAILQTLYQQYQQAPVPLSVLLAKGFQVSYMLCYCALDGNTAFGLGHYSWYYTLPKKDHIIIIQHNGNHPA